MWPFHKHVFSVKYREKVHNFATDSYDAISWHVAFQADDILVIEMCPTCRFEKAYIANSNKVKDVPIEWANAQMILQSERKQK